MQVTYSCSHNRCTFYGACLDKAFRPWETSQVLEDIELAGSVIPNTRHVFLADGDALAATNLDTWIDWKSIPKGEDWEQEIYHGSEGADAFLFLWPLIVLELT